MGQLRGGGCEPREGIRHERFHPPLVERIVYSGRPVVVKRSGTSYLPALEPEENAVGPGADRHRILPLAETAAEEVEFLKQIRFRKWRPTALYNYRELQSFRDPLHFRRK